MNGLGASNLHFSIAEKGVAIKLRNWGHWGGASGEIFLELFNGLVDDRLQKAYVSAFHANNSWVNTLRLVVIAKHDISTVPDSFTILVQKYCHC